MAKRVADTEIEMPKNSSKTIFVITVFLLLSMICGLGFFVLYDKGLIVFDSETTSENGEVSKNKVNDGKSKEETSTILKNDDVNLVKLFNMVSITNNSCDGYDNQDNVVVSGMSVKCKFALASHSYLDKLMIAANGVHYVYESDVRDSYNSLFGYNTYETQEIIPYINGASLTYNATYKYYFYEGDIEEVGSSLTKYEKIISSKREKDELFITSATLFYESINSVLCKDVLCATVMDTMSNEPTFPDYYSLYVDHNKDKLYQYTFKFKMDEAGFYHYVGYERTNQ